MNTGTSNSFWSPCSMPSLVIHIRSSSCTSILDIKSLFLCLHSRLEPNSSSTYFG
jgi:hypothetical protein